MDDAIVTNGADIKMYDKQDMNSERTYTDITLSSASLRDFFLSFKVDNKIRLWEINPNDFSIRCIAIGLKQPKGAASITFRKTTQKTFVSVSQDLFIKLWLLRFEDEYDNLSSFLVTIYDQI